MFCSGHMSFLLVYPVLVSLREQNFASIPCASLLLGVLVWILGAWPPVFTVGAKFFSILLTFITSKNFYHDGLSAVMVSVKL